MTNGEMIQKVFDCEVCEPIFENDIIHVIFADKRDSAIGFDWSWWIAEYKEPTTENDLGVDCISRQAVLELISDYDLSMGQVVKGIHALPSVIPQEPKTGHWIMTHDYFTGAYGSIDYVKCSCCHADSLEEGDYCPNCGCKMVEPQESEVRNELIK